MRKRVHHLQRLRQITNVLLKVELGYVIGKLKLKSFVKLHKQLQSQEFHKPITSLPQRLSEAFEKLGGAFVKLGQLLSLRYDLLPNEFCEEFSKLQDQVKPFPFTSVKRIVEKELGKPINKVFKQFNKKPVAAASVGQVHKAVLKNGEIVAVKVQRPKVEDVFATDIDLLHHLANLLERHFPEIKDYQPKSIVDEFEKYTIKELDYTIEAKNIDLFHKNFKDSQNVKIPKVYWDYSTKKVLVMEFIEGVKIRDVKSFNRLKSSRKKVVENVMNSLIKQVLEYKTFHADPHPGNIFVIRDNRIAFLDFGIVGRLTDEMLRQIEDLLIATINHDVNLLARTLVDAGSIEEGIDMKAFKTDLVDTMADYYDVSLKQINMSGLFLASFNLARKYHIKLPLNYTLLAKSFITMEGFSAKYYPEFNFVDFMKPKVADMLKKRFGPTYILSSVKKTAMDFSDMVRNLPSDVNALIKALKYGAKIDIAVDNKDMRNFTLELDRSSNRMTFGMILAALIVASALLMQTRVPPLFYGIPAVVYVLAVFIVLIGFSLIVSILREGKGGNNT